MKIIMEYISQSYITLMLLAGLTVILIANRKTKIQGTQLVWIIMELVFVLTSCEYLEYWCDTYNKPLWILYFKTTLIYLIYPFIVLLELYLVAPIKRKLLTAIPYAAYAVVVLLNMCGFNLIYRFRSNHSFVAEKLYFLPVTITFLYLLMLMIRSPEFIKRGNRSKGMIVIFMVCSVMLTSALEINKIVIGYLDEIIALEMLLYYFYLSAIHYNKVREELHQQELEVEKVRTKLANNELELEHSKNEMLLAQIQPHFINNSLMALRSRCFDYPEIYESITNFSRYLRSHFEALGDKRLIVFEQEMCNIEAYLALEQENFGERLTVEYDIDCDDFLIPVLSVQPLVENAVRHGVATYEKGGMVYINAHRSDGNVIIEVIDEGSGRNNMTEQQKKRKGIGIENVRARLHSMSNGKLEIISGEHGTTARITIADTGSMGGKR